MKPGKQILIVDDDRYYSELLAERLKEDGCDTHIVGSLKEAKDFIAKTPPDAAIIDVMMPPGEPSARDAVDVAVNV
jgi:DNA-binding response OmpR family regulator